MAVFLIDYENVNQNALEGIDLLTENDQLIIFFSKSCKTIRRDKLSVIENSGCSLELRKLFKAGENALDTYVIAEAGRLIGKGIKEIGLVSEDRIFSHVVEYFTLVNPIKNLTIVRDKTIENCMSKFSNRQDKRRRGIIAERAQKCDLSEYCLVLEERNRIKKAIEDVLIGTEYEDCTGKVIDFVNMNRESGKKALYTNSLKSFGKEKGTKLYNVIKNVI